MMNFCSFGVLGFGCLALSQRGKAGTRGQRIAVWLSGTAAVLCLLPTLVLFSDPLISAGCAEGRDDCGLGTIALLYLSLVLAVAGSLAAAIAWIVYLSTRRSAETE